LSSNPLGQVVPLPTGSPRLHPAGFPPPASSPPRLDWASHRDHLYQQWEPGQHVSVIAPTGRGGKTYLITRGLLDLWRDYRVLFIDCKDRDLTMQGADGKPFFQHRVESFPMRPQVAWASSPKWFRLHVKSGLAGASMAKQQKTIYTALAGAYKQRDWLIVADEISFLSNDLKLLAPLRDIWKRGRSQVTLIAATQSPRWVPGEMYDQPTYLYLGRSNAEGNKRLGEIGGTIDYHQVRGALAGVRRHEFLFIDNAADEPSEAMIITKVGSNG